MATHTDIPDASLDVASPITQPVMIALRDNVPAGLEGASGATINSPAWHPYNASTVGDIADGTIYDFAVDGASGAIESPDFVDGYEYALVVEAMSSNADMNLQARALGGAYQTLATINSATEATSALIVTQLPRFPTRRHTVTLHGASATSAEVTGASDQPMRNFRITGGTTSAGVVRMLRRREFLTG